MTTQLNERLDGVRVAITGGTSGLGLALVGELTAPRRARGVRRPHAANASTRSPARIPARTASSATSRRRKTSTRSRCKSSATLAGSTCSSTTRRASVRLRSRCWPTPSVRISSWRSRPTCSGPSVSRKRCSARWRRPRGKPASPTVHRSLGEGGARARRRKRRAEHLERRRHQCLPAVGCVRREQGGAAPSDAHLGRGAGAEGIRFLSLDPGDMDTPLHALAVPDADPVDAQAS